MQVVRAVEMSSEAAEVLKGLQNGCKQIPFSCLYDQKGSILYEEITELEEYYPFLAEEVLLESYAEQIVDHVPSGTVVTELGCGTGRKTAMLLRAVQSRHGRCTFAGIDVSGPFLESATKNLLDSVPGLKQEDLHMVQADYLEGLRQVRKKFPNELLTVLWLGSSVGNLSNEGAISFLQDVTTCVGPHHQFFLCADMWKDEDTLYAAYHDSKGVTERFIKNGMANALRMLGADVMEEEEEGWVYEVEVNRRLRRVEMYLRFPHGVQLPHHISVSSIMSGERVLVEVSRKFTIADLQHLASQAGYIMSAAWRSPAYGSQMLVPAGEALRQCWDDTDHIFRGLDDWRVKPIDLRHPFCFYYGHVHAFAKLKLLPDEDASHLDVMFSRGIDPNVVDPSKCHSHPDIPPEWPATEDIIQYGKQVRDQILQALAGGIINMRMVNFGLEHERMHQETLQYMVAQERRLVFEKNFESRKLELANGNGHHSNGHAKKQTTVHIPPGLVHLGTDTNSGQFCWDNEYPPHQSRVEHPVVVSTRPVSVSDFRTFVVQNGYQQKNLWRGEDYSCFHGKGVKCPATWSLLDGDFWVHSPSSSHHWSQVASEAVFVSLAEAMAYCAWAGARIMTEVEYHRILDVVDADVGRQERKHLLQKGIGHRSGKGNGNGVNGVGAARIEQIRTGGWEWTSSVFEPFPGFQPMIEYPEYSADFFDGEHYVLKGSSPVTHPSMLRDSFRNFYQRLYPYVFAKFRCCFDL